HAEPVDHRRVRVRTDERIWICHGLATLLTREDHATEVLEIHLMADAGTGWNDAEVVERVLSPAQELIALAIPLELFLGVDEKSGFSSVLVDLHGVIDHEVDRLQRVDALRVSTELDHRIAHCGEVDDARHAGEILQQYPTRSECD